jgi:hypothetical protein
MGCIWLLLVAMIVPVSCGTNRTHLITNKEDRWKEDSRAVEILLQYISRKTGHLYVLDDRLSGMRIVPSSRDPLEMLNELQVQYQLSPKESEGRTVLTPTAPTPFYAPFNVPAGEPTITL